MTHHQIKKKKKISIKNQTGICQHCVWPAIQLLCVLKKYNSLLHLLYLIEL